ncbi:MAG TPA: GNAT family N-acetyltransferase [Dehalococcoidia bacterium]|nr:GNAT family N-acetyltransferase [Dehalococcoidia bacterium]
MIGYAAKRKLGEKPADLMRNQHRSAAWYEQTARDGLAEGVAGARLIARVNGTDARIGYEFSEPDALRKQFPELWQQLEPRLRQAGVVNKAFLDFEDRQRRRWIEPVLVGQLFTSGQDYVLLERARTAPPASQLEIEVGKPETNQYGDILALLRAESFHSSTDPNDLATDLARALWAGVVDIDGVAGFAQLWEIDGTVHLEDLVVAETHRGKGYGEVLLSAALNWVAENRPGPVRLYTNFERTAAMGLYRKHGFRQLYTGVTFERPMDPAEIEKILSRRKNTYSRWVGFR